MPDESTRKPAGAQVAIRADADAVERLDALARRLSYPGHPLTRADALRIVMVRGLDVFDEQLRGSRTDSVAAPLSPPPAASPAPVPTSPEPRERLAARGGTSPVGDSPARGAKPTALQGVEAPRKVTRKKSPR